MPIDLETDVISGTLTDVHSKDLHQEVSERLKIQYLSDPDNIIELKEIKGIIFGHFLRPVVSLPVKINQRIKNVHFLINTGSSNTYICKEALSRFNVASDRFTYSALINNKPVTVYTPPGPEFKDVNLLGTGYLQLFQVILIVDFDFEFSYVSISFPEDDDNIKFDQFGNIMTFDNTNLGSLPAMVSEAEQAEQQRIF